MLDRRLKVMDLTAFTLCRENGLQIIVFDMDTPGNLGKVLAGERIGTLVKNKAMATKRATSSYGSCWR